LREPTQRLFFALWPEEELRSVFARATCKAARACGGRPVPIGSLHVTLAFLGPVAVSRIPGLGAIAREVAAKLPPLALTFDCLEHWPKSQLLCAAASEAVPQVAALAEELKRQTAGGGFTPDLKPFRAHVTVARKVVRAACCLHEMRAVRWVAADFTLMSSRTDPEGPAYSVVESYSLDGREFTP
jgi:2'-5' RNA ligase